MKCMSVYVCMNLPFSSTRYSCKAISQKKNLITSNRKAVQQLLQKMQEIVSTAQFIVHIVIRSFTPYTNNS